MFISQCLGWIVFAFLLFSGLCILGVLYQLYQRRKRHLYHKHNGITAVSVGFFHPYCNAGGGGERVLWCAIRSLQERYEYVDCIIYTGDVDASEQEILERAHSRFNITLPRSVKFVYLKRRRAVEASLYPYFTLLGQSLGSLVLGMEALMKFIPDIFIDSMGYAFVLPLFKYLGFCQVGCYVHYPTISTDMLDRVSSRVESQNNRRIVARSKVLTNGKLLYYRMFAFCYGIVGSCADVIMVNSSWTKNHIVTLWKKPEKTKLVYPPCNVEEFKNIAESKRDSNEIIKVISIGQFRPEKDHQLQIRAFERLFKKLPENQAQNVYLILAGSCRNEEDQERVSGLKNLCRKLNIEQHVVFRVNVSFSDLLKEMSESLIGIHTMWNEHFGIGVVESMAAGLIMVAHDSGGPKLDIVTRFEGQPTGFLASDEETYSEALEKIIEMSTEERSQMRRNATESVLRFSDERFKINFLSATDSFFSDNK